MVVCLDNEALDALASPPAGVVPSVAGYYARLDAGAGVALPVTVTEGTPDAPSAQGPGTDGGSFGLRRQWWSSGI